MAITTQTPKPLTPNLRPPEDCKILIVDDDARIVDIFSMLLALDNYQILSAGDGRTALKIIEEEKPDVVLLDVILPDLSGLEVCLQIKENPETHFLPVILVTALAARQQRMEGLEAGADDFLTKPVDPLELSVRVRSLLRSKQLYDKVEAHRQDLEQRIEERTLELQSAYKRLQQLSRVKSNILSIVSHELLTPLLQAKSALDLATDEEISEAKKAPLLKTVGASLKQLNYRVNDIQTLSDPYDLNLSATSLNDLVRRAAEQVKDFRPRDSDRIELNLQKSLAPVHVDSAAIIRALAHLIENGLKFSAEAKTPVTVTTDQVDAYVQIKISDKGEGISDTAREGLFEPLELGDHSATRSVGGLGIGLAMVKMIVDAHHIPIDIQSEKGKGTTISLRFPISSTLV